jgi:hypothetical protein
VGVVASSFPDEGLPADEGGDYRADLPFRTGGNGHQAHTEARAELRDRETYYAELRFAVHCQSRSIPAPRAALDNEESSFWTHGASATSAPENGADQAGTNEDDGTEGDSWDEMIARFGDTWT